MKMMMSVVALVSMLTTHSVLANEGKGSVGQGVEKRVEKQNARIDRKLKNNKITAEQAAELKKDVKAIEEKKVAMANENGGKLSKEQRKELHGDLKKTSEEIKSTTAQPQKQ